MMQANNLIGKKMLPIGIAIFFLIALTATVHGEYSLQLDWWVGEGNCPDATYYASQVHQGIARIFWQSTPNYPAHEFGCWPLDCSALPLFTQVLGCDRSLSATRDAHHPVLQCMNYPVCDQTTPTASFGQVDVGGYTYFYAFPDMRVRGAYAYFPGFRTEQRYDFPFQIYRCQNGDCVQLNEGDPSYNANEYYKPNVIGSVDLVNDSFPDLWGESYEKTFQQFTINQFGGSVQGTQLTFCWDIDKYTHSGYRQECGIGCPNAMHVSNPSVQLLDDCDTLTVPCTAPGATCGDLHCNPTTGACMQCLDNSQCGTNQACVSNQCVEACPAECSTFDVDTLTCGSLPPTCCSDPASGCRTPKPACGSQDRRGTACTTGGVCNTTTWQCECPAECIVDPNTVNCGTPLFPPGNPCLTTHAAICNLPTPPIGWKCTDIDTACANYNNNTQCWSADSGQQQDSLPCGETVSPLNGNPASMTGLFCDSANDDSHKMCDRAKPSPTCIPILKRGETQYPSKYLFDVANGSDFALWYNIWFKFRFNTNDNLPQLKNYEAEHPTALGTYCFDCSTPVDPATAYQISLTPSDTNKEGLIRFFIENKQLFGPNNYSRVKLSDKTNPAKSGHAGELDRNEFAILKLNAGYSGECISEDRTFKGETGSTIAPKAEYEWNWGTQGHKREYCNPASPNGVYCDSTQFTIALFDRMETIEQKLQRGETFDDLKQFNAQLMTDGFSEDFLKDFQQYMLHSSFADPPSWFTESWNKYSDPSRLEFQNNSNPTNPLQITAPGTYAVLLEFTFGPSEEFFENNEPDAHIRVTFEKTADASPNHPLYYLPIDARLGETIRPDETEANRVDYGKTFSGSPLPLTATGNSTFVSSSGSIPTTSLSAFNETNVPSQRGKLLSIDLQTPEITFAPAGATPIVMKTTEKNSVAEAYYALLEGTTAVSLSPSQPIATWTGIGSKNLNSNCNGFHNLPLYFQRSDTTPTIDSCVSGNGNARGFYWSNVGSNQAVFFEGIVYTPSAKNYALITQCNDTNAQWVTYKQKIIHNSSIQTLDLDFTQAQGMNVSSLTAILDNLRNGNVCQYVSPDNQKVTFFWNREKLFDSLESGNGFNYDRYDLINANELCEQPPSP